MDGILQVFADPAAWAALITLVVMEVVLGIDNLIFISILSNKLPEANRQKVRRIGISLALIIDCVIDPIVGELSDNLSSRWGRRRGGGRPGGLRPRWTCRGRL